MRRCGSNIVRFGHHTVKCANTSTVETTHLVRRRRTCMKEAESVERERGREEGRKGGREEGRKGGREEEREGEREREREKKRDRDRDRDDERHAKMQTGCHGAA